jgi:hypothetical protein
VKRAVHHSAVWLVVPLWLILLGTVLARVGILAYENHLFATEALHVRGTVVTKYLLSARGRHDDSIPVLIYSYTAGNLRGRCATEVTFETYGMFQVGNPIPVMYLPGDPTDNRLDLRWEDLGFVWGPYDDLVFAGMIFVPGACLTWYFGLRNRIHARLKAAGSNGVGEVTEVCKSYHRCGSNTYLTFHFTTAQGVQIHGRTPSLRAHEPTHWEAGDPIRVFYDPKKPSHFAVDTDHPLDMLLPDERPPTPSEATIWA